MSKVMSMVRLPPAGTNQEVSSRGIRSPSDVMAVMTARKELGVKGFQAVGGKSAQGKALYAKAKSLYA